MTIKSVGLTQRLSMVQTFRFWVAVLLGCLAFYWNGSSSSLTRVIAQEIPPRVVLNTGGPTSQIRQLAFSSDSQRLYVAGLDKVIYTYEVGWAKGGPDAPPAVTLAAPIHWEQARGNRGSVYATAIAGSRPEMVVGGVSARQQTGDIAVVNLGQSRVTASLPTPAERTLAAKAKQIGTEGHRFAVVSLDFSPSGDAIVSRDEAGGMFLWQRNAGGSYSSKRLHTASQDPFKNRSLAIFVDERNVVFSKEENGGRVRLFIKSVATGNQVAFSEDYRGRVAALARDTIGKFWASADAQGTVYLSDTSSSAKRYRIQAGWPNVTAIAFGGGGDDVDGSPAPETMAVLSSEYIDGRNGKTIVELFDVVTRRRIDQRVISEFDPCLAAAITSDGRFLAVSHESPRSVSVIRLVDEVGNRVAKPFNKSTNATLEANVKPCGFLALSPDESKLGFGPKPEQFGSAWDLRLGELVGQPLAGIDWKLPSIQPPGWRVEKNGQPVDQLVLTDGNGTRWQIDLEFSRQGALVSHCFLFAGNQTEPVGIAIGTENVNSIFVYRFDEVGQSGSAFRHPKLVRWFRDHTGTVSSLIANEACTVLYSGSLDHTIKQWRLSGLFDAEPKRSFPNASHWGCDFVIDQGNVVVQDIDPSGIAFARSLRNGDRIERIQGFLASEPSKILDAIDGRESAQQILDALSRVSVLNQNLIYASPDPNINQNDAVKTKKFIIRPAWLPFLTAFANRRGEWVIWHPDGVFDASAAEGGTLFDWMILRGQNQSPRMLKAAFLAKEFERPEVIRKLMNGEVLNDVALQSVSGQSLASVIRATPEVRITKPGIGELIAADGKSNVVAEIDFGDADRNAYQIVGNIDAVRLGTPQRKLIGNNQYQYKWDATPTGLLNQIEVVAHEDGGVLETLFASDVAYRRGNLDNPTPYQLHFLSLASEAYIGPIATKRGGFGELEFPIDDVDAIVGKLNEKQDAGLSHYRLGTVLQLNDDQISKKSVDTAITNINQKMRRDVEHQILIVYLSGHGTTIDGEYHYVTTSSRSPLPSALKESSLPWSLIERAGVPGCRIIYMIDTCHSGSVVDAKSSIRGALRRGGMVIAAASGRGAAQELTPLRHGCFTFSVLSALEGEADGALSTKRATNLSSSTAPNGVVELEELVAFVRNDVRKLTGGQQKPTTTPSRLTDNLNIDLVATPK